MNREDIIRMAQEAGMVHDEDDDSFFSPSNLGMDVHINNLKRFAAIVAALEAKDEPIATKNNDGVTLHLGWDDLPVGTKLYATPPQQEAKDEPVAWMDASRFEELRNGFTVMTTLTKKKAFFDDVAIYTTPPQRTWVGLTDNEFEDLVEDEDWFNDPVNFAKIIQNKLKEKNT